MGDFDSESSSSDGDNAGEVKNVARLVMRPPGHSGKAKKGHLVFDASFEGGNLGRVDYVGELDYDLYVRPDIANLRHRVWFNFTVENVRADQLNCPYNGEHFFLLVENKHCDHVLEIFNPCQTY
ncbi:Cytosolic carboxypeptidase 6 like protein [Argiope bruennichi]|uniref:Cytosolic carboxypeptidase 6 like protein n=1 Tax=Argiope bruennichi TaxID=94029 RepID=A0A8T0FXG3_ARGBR|nr:Cytosolic carboxypeptidase 6 like protein [Argiope bruennichi]